MRGPLRTLALSSVVVLIACEVEPDDIVDTETDTVDTVDTVDTTPDTEETDEPEETGDTDAVEAGSGFVTVPFEVRGLPNRDDDNENGTMDWNESPFGSENDLAVLELLPDAANEGTLTVSLELSGEVNKIRLWDPANSTQPFLGPGTATAEVAVGADPVTLWVEFKDHNVAGELLVSLDPTLDPKGEHTQVVGLHAGPLVLNHHLQPSEELWATELTSGWYDNSSFIQSFTDVFGAAFTPISGSYVGGDVWMQDEFEFATVKAEGGAMADIVIDSIRNRGLEGLAEAQWEVPDAVVRTWGNDSPYAGNSQDSFGNLEASPPLEADGVDYPWGRVYYGATTSGFGPTTALQDMLDEQLVQAPFLTDTRFLCVGHIDEVTSFVPDPTAPRGFRFLMADTDAAYTLLDGLDPNLYLPMYAGGGSHGISDVGEMVDDVALRDLNEELQADWLDPMLQTFVDELDLTEEEIILFPTIFEVVSQCGGATAALIPGMVNLQVGTVNGQTHVMMADPFLRSSNQTQAEDPMIAAVTALMPPSLELHFVDDFDVYHLGLGEVHCGSNARRTPDAADWWLEGRDLLGMSPLPEEN